MPNNEAYDYFTVKYPFGRSVRRAGSILSHRARRQMYELFVRCMAPTPGMTVLDVGVTPDEIYADSNFFEALYPYKDRITATSVEDASFLERKFPQLRFVRTDGRRLPFADDSFDVVVCFAVLEHVGERSEQRAFIAELLRVGRRLFLTTPNRGFPLDFHTLLPFVHWLPRKQHQALLRRFGMHFYAQTKNLNLLTLAELRAMFPVDAQVSIDGFRFMGMRSNLIATRRSP